MTGIQRWLTVVALLLVVFSLSAFAAAGGRPASWALALDAFVVFIVAIQIIRREVS